MFFLVLMCQCAEVEEKAWGIIHAIPNVLTSSCKHGTYTNKWPQEWRCNTHQAHKWYHLVERLDPIVLVFSFI
jgi:hypothetical protein